MRFDLSDEEWALLEPLNARSSKERALTIAGSMNAIFYIRSDAHAVGGVEAEAQRRLAFCIHGCDGMIADQVSDYHTMRGKAPD